MIVRLKSGELQELNLENFINENDIYKFIISDKFEKTKIYFNKWNEK